MIRKLVIALAIVISLAGCLKNRDNSVTCTYNPCALKAPDTEIQAVKSFLDSSQIAANQHCSGLFYTIQAPGSGKTPQSCLNVIAIYKGMLTNGKVFDQSTSGVEFNLGGVIRGWTNGIPLVKNGGKITLYIPPSLAYGNQTLTDQNGNVAIPANSILIFEVEIIAVQ